MPLTAGVCSVLTTIDMPSVTPIVWSREKGKNRIYPIVGDVVGIGTWCANIEVHAITQIRYGTQEGTSNHAQNDIGDIVVWAPAVGEARSVIC